MANKIVDIAGQRFGLLTAKDIHGRDAKGRCLWRFACDCGAELVRAGHDVRQAAKNGKVSSCGCNSHLRTHGMTYTHRRLQWVWSAMRRRCQSSSCKDYPNYGGRGIRVCSAWQNFAAFAAWAQATGYAEGMTIERVDVNGNYEPGNCAWVRNERQALNRRNNHQFTHDGRTQSIREWSEESGVPYYRLRSRLLNYGWPIERALTA